VTTRDPWEILGLPPGASVAAARAARRQLAKQLHPDLHTLAAPADAKALSSRMTIVNEALAEIERRESKPPPVAAEAPFPPVPAPGADPDDDSFSVGWLPAEAFEVLFLAAYGLGDILVADEPYLLEIYLPEPGPCFCRLTLVPEAGGSIVTVDISAAADGRNVPAPAAVIRLLIAELNALVSG
jgi:hypothetical protein